MKDLISKERIVDTLYDYGFQVLSDHTMKSTIEFETIMKCINCIESQPVIYSVEKAQEDIKRMKAYEQQNMAICKEFDINTIKNLYPQAINECLEIVKYYSNSWDGIEWAIRDIEELLKKYDNEIY